MGFQFFMPAHVLGGTDAVMRNANIFASFGNSCLIVTGAHSAQACGALDDVVSALRDSSVSYQIYSGIGENPLMTSCQEAAAVAISCGAQFIIGIGGGSPQDSAKIIAVLAANPGMDWQDAYRLAWKRHPLPIILVGTTSGTGSEVTPTAVITDPDGKKRGISHPDLYADISFADPKYTYSLPRSVTISTGLDALAHASESFLSPLCDSVSSAFAVQAIPVLSRHLYALSRGDDLTSQMHAELYDASLWAGLMLNAVGTAYPHPFGYVLTEDFGIPHGRACTTFLPSLFTLAEKHTPERAQQYLSLTRCSKEQFLSMLDILNDVSHIHMTEAQIQKYLPRFEGLKHYRNVPGGFSVQDAEALFRGMFL